MRAAAMIAAIGGLATSLGAYAAAPGLPAAVQTELAAMASICTDVGGKALTDEAVQRADLNADGKDDYVLDVGRIQCEGAASAYGDRAKDVIVFVGDGSGGAAKGWSGVAYGSRIEGSKLWLGVSGAECGKPPAKDFASESFCERPLAWNAAQRKLEFAPVSAVQMLQ
jgi:hypothetical protein